jgi:hypothetical protein
MSDDEDLRSADAGQDPLEEPEENLPAWWRGGKPTPRLDPRLFLMMVVVLVVAVAVERCWSWVSGQGVTFPH